MSNKPKHLYITHRSALMSVAIDMIVPLCALGVGALQVLYYPAQWQVTFVVGVVAFGILNQARYDTKKLESTGHLIDLIVASIPKDKLLELAGYVACQALEHAPAKAGGVGLEIDFNGDRYMLTLCTREAFTAMTNGNVNRSKPNL